MKNLITFFSISRIGENKKDIQDSFAHSDDYSLAAIADGASSSLFPKECADISVQEFCSSSASVKAIKNSLEDWLKPLQEKWVKNYLISSKYTQLPWWAKGSENKNYVSATFVGLKLKQLNSGEKYLKINSSW